MTQQTKFTSDDTFAFFRLLMELGGAFTVNPTTGEITRGDDDEPMTVTVGTGNKAREMRYRMMVANMETGDWVTINPLNETIKANSERRWFWSALSTILGSLTKYTLVRLLQARQENETPLELMDIASKLPEDIDEKTIANIERIDASHLLTIFYDTTEHVAQAQCAMMDDEWRAETKSYNFLRKKDWTVIEAFIPALFEKPVHYLTGTGKIAAIFEAEARLEVIGKLIQHLAVPAKLLLDIELPVEEFQKHMEHLRDYQKAVAWYVTTPKGAPTTTAKPKSPPWRTMANQFPRPTTYTPPPPAVPPPVPAPSQPGYPPPSQQPNHQPPPAQPSVAGPTMRNCPPPGYPQPTPGMAAPQPQYLFDSRTGQYVLATPQPMPPMVGYQPGYAPPQVYQPPQQVYQPGYYPQATFQPPVQPGGMTGYTVYNQNPPPAAPPTGPLVF